MYCHNAVIYDIVLDFTVFLLLIFNNGYENGKS